MRDRTVTDLVDTNTVVVDRKKYEALLKNNASLAIENKGLRMEIEALKAAAWRPSLPSEEKHSDDFDKIDR